MTLETIREAIAALEHEGKQTARFVVNLSESDATVVAYPDTGWTVKDALGHVAASNDAILHYMKGEPVADASIRDLNERNEYRRRARQAWSLNHLVDELNQTRQAAISFLSSLGEADATRVARSASGVERALWQWAWVLPGHERDHRWDAQRALGQPVPAAYVAALNVSPGGVPKLPVFRRSLGETGLDGDGHRNPRHGGPTAALCLLGLDVIQRLQHEGHPIQPGTVGENVTVAGLSWPSLHIGDQLRIGSTVVELNRFTTPCTNVTGAFKDGDFTRILATKYPGEARIYAHVVEPGTIATGDPVEVVR